MNKENGLDIQKVSSSCFVCEKMESLTLCRKGYMLWVDEDYTGDILLVFNQGGIRRATKTEKVSVGLG